METFYAWAVYFAAPSILIAVIAWVYRPSARSKYNKAKRIPFDESDRNAGAER